MRSKILIFVILFVSMNGPLIYAQSFVHPGLLHNLEDIKSIKRGISEKQEPISAGFEVFRKNAQSQSTYVMQGPLASVGRNPTVGQGAYDSDANAAYQCALMWSFTGDIAFANKAKEIVNGWSSVLKSITGKDAVLMAGLGPFKMINAAEILRYTNAGWSKEEILQTEVHFKEVVYPVVKDFAPFANGNWDAAALQTVMAIGIFCNDRQIYERALHYYVDGWGDGSLDHYIINADGQVQESGRDQQHTQLGLGLLSECCEMAWHQGLDLYAFYDNRLLKGFEYTAKYNLGNEVPFTVTTDRTGKYIHKVISEAGKGQLRPVYEQVFNHYVNRIGLEAPFTQLAAEKIRPEDQGRPGADHPGFGTLLYTRPPSKGSIVVTDAVPSPPGGIVARGMGEVSLTWVASVNATNYTVKRAVKSGGPFVVIKKNISEPSYIDKAVKPGKVYYYTITASDIKGESSDAQEVAVCAGLPTPWNQSDIGAVSLSGRVNYNGNIYTIEAGGTEIGVKSDQFKYVYMPLKGNGTLIARFIPQVSSQFTKMGIMIRENLSDNSKHFSMLICSEPSGSIEAPGWVVQILSRDSAGSETIKRKTSPVLTDPIVTNGRLTGFYWLKLERTGNLFTGYVSGDGIRWEILATIQAPLADKAFIGISSASGINAVTTTIRVDNLTVSK